MKNFIDRLRRLPKWLVRGSILLIVLIVVIYCGIGWYFSGKLFELAPQKVEYDQTVEAIDGNSYKLKGSAFDIDGIVSGIRTDRSSIGIFEKPTNLDKENKTSERILGKVTSELPKVGDKISLQGNIWLTDPKQALGLDYQDVKYDTELGPMDAWVVPGVKSDVWTVAVHGVGAQKNEMLRFVNPINQAGNTAMVISYRGDVDSPAPKDGRNHFGDTEWRDVESAVKYAKEHGAKTINLFGSSLGGSLTQNYLRRSADVSTSNISRVVLDSPALDWDEILKFRIKKMGYPTLIAQPGKTFAGLRAGIDFGRITTKPGSITLPTLIIHNIDDNSVPQAASKRVADTQPDLVTLVDFGSGGHIRAWNHDSVRYEKLVSDFLKEQ